MSEIIHQEIDQISSLDLELGVDLKTLSREELQALAKKVGIRANLKSAEIRKDLELFRNKKLTQIPPDHFKKSTSVSITMLTDNPRKSAAGSIALIVFILLLILVVPRL